MKVKKKPKQKNIEVQELRTQTQEHMRFLQSGKKIPEGNQVEQNTQQGQFRQFPQGFPEGNRILGFAYGLVVVLLLSSY